MNHGYVKGVGPACPPGSKCPCGRPAACECQGCGKTCCVSCWWRHGQAIDPHRLGDEVWVGPRPAAERGSL